MAYIPPIGICFGGGWLRESEDQIQRDLDEAAAVGFTHTRWDVTWISVEPSKGRFFLDRKIQVAEWCRERNLKVLGVMGYTPRFYQADTSILPGFNQPPPPRFYDAWRAYCRALFAALKPIGVLAYEPWNEPNNPPFWWKPSPPIHIALLRIAREEADTAGVRLVVGALAPVGRTAPRIQMEDYVGQLYANGLKGLANNLSLHPYSYPGEPDLLDAKRYPWAPMGAKYDAIRAHMTANGEGSKRLWGTEFGYTTGGDKKVTESEQARLICKQIDVWRARPMAGPGFVFNWRDMGTGAADGWLGIHRADGTPKPAVAALRSHLAP